MNADRKAKLLQIREILVAYADKEGFEFTKKQLKKKKLAKIDEALSTITTPAYIASHKDVCKAFELLRDYELIDDNDNGITYNERQLVVKLILTDLGKRIATVLYGNPVLPPMDTGGIAFGEYEAGYNVTGKH